MEMPLPAAVVFDNDGLLLDTESVWTRAEQDLFERRKIEFTPAHKRELVGTSAEIAGGILERRLGELGRAVELIDELNELVVAELEHGVEAMLGASELLHRLKRRGTPIGLVSNSPLSSFGARWRSSASPIASTLYSAPTKSPRPSRRRTRIWRHAGGSASRRVPRWWRSRTRRPVSRRRGRPG